MGNYLPNHLGTLISDYSNTKLTQKVNSFLILSAMNLNLKKHNDIYISAKIGLVFSSAHSFRGWSG